MTPSIRHSAPFGGAVAVLVLVLGTGVLAQDPLFLYSLREHGQIKVGGTELVKLPGHFNPADDNDPTGWHRWVDLLVIDAERWALRLNGRIENTDGWFTKLRFSIVSGAPVWLRLDVTGTTVRALRDDGLIFTRNSLTAAEAALDEYDVYPPDNSYFTDFVVGTGNQVYVLRADGYVFGPDFNRPVARFTGDDDLDGVSFQRSWVRIQQDDTGELVGLRGDGLVHEVVPGAPANNPVESVQLTNLPVPSNRRLFDREVLPDGTWFALTEDGRLFKDPGDPEIPPDEIDEEVIFQSVGTSEAKTFRDLISNGNDLWALRFDGNVYRYRYIPVPPPGGTGDPPGDPPTDPPTDPTQPVIDLVKGHNVRLAASDVPPNTEGFQNQKPVLTAYNPRLVQGATAFVVPTLLTDADHAIEELTTGFDLSGLRCESTAPCGDLDFSEELRRVSLPNDLERGSHHFVVTARDKVVKNDVSRRFKVKVFPADDNPNRNRRPLAAKIKRVQALVGTELVLPLQVADRDGDTVTITELDKGLFASDPGAVLENGVLRWTPSAEHVGKTFAKFEASDGQKTRRFMVRISVVAPLIFTGETP